MNLKDLYFGAVAQFLHRNGVVLPHVQLQYGRNERWFAREFALAMNAWLDLAPAALHSGGYADCEHKFVDISVWRPGDEVAWLREVLYEVKALYTQRFSPEGITKEDDFGGVVERARQQLTRSCNGRIRKVGLFWLIYNRRLSVPPDDDGQIVAGEVDAFQHHARGAIRQGFTSDHDIRLTELCPPTPVVFGRPGQLAAQRWTTASWVTWGTPK